MARHTRFGGRTLARSQALQLLFQAEATGRMVVDVLAGEYALSDGPLESFGEQLAVGADSMREDLDAVMEMTSANWGVSRMNAVDRNLLRLSIYEMLMVDDVDVAVTIDECVELAKAYGTDESSRFVNGLLGRVATLMDEGADVVAVAREKLGLEPSLVRGASQGFESYEGADWDAAPAASPEGEADLAQDAPAHEEAQADAAAFEEPAAAEAEAPEEEPEAAYADDDLPAWAREA